MSKGPNAKPQVLARAMSEPQASLKRKAEDSPAHGDVVREDGDDSAEIEVSEADLATVIRVLEAFGKDITQLHR